MLLTGNEGQRGGKLHPYYIHTKHASVVSYSPDHPPPSLYDMGVSIHLAESERKFLGPLVTFFLVERILYRGVVLQYLLK